MLYTISIYWERDSSDLVELPDVNVLTCGSDGMEVIGTHEAIETLADYVAEHPDLYTTEGMKEADESDIQGALQFAPENYQWGTAGDRICVYEHLEHKTSDYYYILAETPQGTRYWIVVGDKDNVDGAEQRHVYRVEAHDHDHAVAIAEANGCPEAWVANGEVVWLDKHLPDDNGMSVKVAMDLGLYKWVVVPNLDRLDALVASGVKPSQILLVSELRFDPSKFDEIYVDKVEKC